MIITMRDPVKSQNVAVLCGGPVLLHRVAPLLDQIWHLCNHDDHGDGGDDNVDVQHLLHFLTRACTFSMSLTNLWLKNWLSIMMITRLRYILPERTTRSWSRQETDEQTGM